jgi:gliding motility-associated-like protein
MKKLYFLLITILFSNYIYSQVNVVLKLRQDNHYEFININTKQKVNDSIWDETEPFVNDYAKVFKKGKWGFVDGSGNVSIKNEYESVRDFQNNIAAAQQNDKWGFIDKEGKTIVPFEYDIVYDFKEDFTTVYKNNNWFFINKVGKIIKELDVDIFWGFENGIAKITKNDQDGFMNIEGKIISLSPAKKKIDFSKYHPINSKSNSTLAAPCPTNIDFELNNFVSWICYKGLVAAVGTTNIITVTANVPPTTPTPTRHTLYAKVNPSLIDAFGFFPTNPPDGSNVALRLGNTDKNNEAERVSYLINVPVGATDASITYRYAVVFQDPPISPLHQPYEKPQFTAKLFDVTGGSATSVPCATYIYIASANLGADGFFTSTVSNIVRYKPWTSVFINLSAYAGRTMRLEFTTADCTQGAHWGYAYVDVGNCNVTASINYSCNPSSVSLLGPPGFQTYNWWNTNYTTVLGTGQNPTLTPAPPLGTIMHVEVIPFSGNGCRDTLDVVVTDNNPAVNAGPDKTICITDSTSIGTSPSFGNTYSWSPPAYLSNPNIPNPNASPPVTTTYYLTATNGANGCSNIDSIIVVVKPTPDLIQPADLTLCNGTSTALISFSSSFLGTTYNWTNSNTAIGLAASGSSNIPVFVATNNTNAQITSTITVTPTFNGCPGPAKTFEIKVDPTPSVIAPADQIFCNGSNTTAITLTGTVTGATYNWTNNNTATGLGASGSNTIPAFVATNNTTAQITSTITITPTTSTCPGPPKIFVIKVNPIPSVTAPADQTFCNGTNTTAITLIGNVAGATYNWTNNNTTIGLGASGSNSIPVFVATNNTNAQITSTITVTPTFNGCPGPTKIFVIKVDPTPSVTAPPDPIFCNGVTTTNITLTGTVLGATYNWTNNNTATGLGASGSNTIPAFVATNNTTAQITSTIIITPTASTCPGPPKIFVIKVNPIPSVTAPADQIFCNGANTNAITITGSVTGATYNWTNSNTATGLGASGSNTIPVFTATNNTNAQISSTITITPTTSGCPGPAKIFVIKVDPAPSVTVPLDQIFCNGSNTNAIILTGNVAGANYNWTNNNTTTGLGASGSNTIPVFVATNTNNAQINSTITITPTASGCAGPTKTFVIKVDPTPSATVPADPIFCNGVTTPAITLGGTVTGATYNWTNNNVATGLAASGTNGIPVFVATNNTNAQISSTITITPAASGCPGPAKTFVIKVNPTPSTTAPLDKIFCNGISTVNAITLNGTVAGATYNWTNDNTATGLGASGLNTIPVFTATNNTNTQISSTITITPAASACAGTPKIFVIKVNPTPSATAPSDPIFCNGVTTTAIILTGSVTSATYNWTNNNTAIGLGASGSNTIPSFIATNNTNAQISSTITITPAASGCVGTSKTFVIKVNPTPGITKPDDQTLCANTNTAAITFGGGINSTTYNWTNNNTAIGLAASGTGNINSFVALNNTNNQIISTITITPTANGCVGSPKIFFIKVNPILTITPSNDASICKGANIHLSAQGGQSFTWTPAIGLSCSQCPDPFASPDTTTTYFINSFPNTGCQNTGTIKITVHQPIQITASPNQQICSKESFNLWVNGASRYEWSPAQGLSSTTSPNPIAIPIITTQYKVVGYDNYNCFTDTKYVTIVVNPKPTIQLGVDQTLSTGSLFPLTSVVTNGPIIYWTWTPVTDLSCTNCSKPVATIKKDITYTALVKNIYGCTATDDIRIRTLCEASQVYIPNVFTPDGDGKNDILMVRSKGVGTVRSFKIYSRWGELIFEKTNFPPNNPLYGWDGKIKGILGTAEVYVYIAEVTCDNDEKYFLKGNVSILK